MASDVTFVDFSQLHLTKQERRLLRITCNKPQRTVKSKDSELFGRLAELGLVELFEAADPAKDAQGVFPTPLGKEYLAYAIRSQRVRVLDAIKWLVPLLVSVVALVFAIRANSARASSTAVQPARATTPTAATTPAAQSAQPAPQASANSAGTQTQTTQPQGAASGAMGASGEQTN